MESGLYQPKMKERLAWVMLFVPHGTIKGPCSFYFFLFSWSALPGVFLGQFLRILAVGLAGPRSTRLHGAARRRRQERGSPCKSQSCRRSGVFLALVCLLLNAATARRLSSAWPVCHPWRHRPSWSCDCPPRVLRCLSRARLVLNWLTKGKWAEISQCDGYCEGTQ